MYSYDGEGELHEYTAGRTEEGTSVDSGERTDSGSDPHIDQSWSGYWASRYYRAKGLSIMCFHYAIFDACVPEAREMCVHGAYTQADEY